MLPAMFIVSEADAAAIRAAYEQEGELSAAVEVRRLFPGITDNAEALSCARTIAGWKLWDRDRRGRHSAVLGVHPNAASKQMARQSQADHFDQHGRPRVQAIPRKGRYQQVAVELAHQDERRNPAGAARAAWWRQRYARKHELAMAPPFDAWL